MRQATAYPGDPRNIKDKTLNNVIKAVLKAQRKTLKGFLWASRVELFSTSNADHIIIAKRMCWWALHKHYGAPVQSIGLDFNRDHSTVSVGIQRIRKKMAENVVFQQFADETIRLLMSMEQKEKKAA